MKQASENCFIEQRGLGALWVVQAETPNQLHALVEVDAAKLAIFAGGKEGRDVRLLNAQSHADLLLRDLPGIKLRF